MTSVRPSRRAAAVSSRRRLVQSDSDEDDNLVEDSQPTPTSKPATRRSTTGSRTSFDEDYTPVKKGRTTVTSTPISVQRKTQMTPQTRAPLTEAKKSRQQSQTPRSTVKKASKIASIKEGFEDLVIHESQKENVTPLAKQFAPKAASQEHNTAMTTKLRPMSPIMDVIPVSRNEASEIVSTEPTGPKTRIVISKLVLENFKSYAGIQQIGPFHKSFSAVVGPNGSGKSNVIDSLLFVFGFRASKMRQGKISALIHNSAAYPDLDHCSVEVHFQTIYDTDEPTDYRIVEDSTIVVARHAFKNNASKYTINKRESSFTEVTTLLRDKGIDLDHKRFLILQGEVESIAQMRPKAANEHDDGLLEYLEDIIGTSKYKSPIEGALERMEALSTICQEKSARVLIVEKERSRLEEQKNLAVQQILSENELVLKQSMLYQAFAHDCSSKIAMSKDVASQLEQELQQEAPTLQKNDMISSLEKKHKLAMKNHDELKALLAKYVAESSKSEKAIVQLQEKEKHLSSKKKRLLKSSDTAEHASKECAHQVESLEAELAKHTAEMKSLSSNHAKEEKELGKIRYALKDKTQAFVEQIEAKQRQKQPWDIQIAEKRSLLEVAKSELEMLNQKSAQAERDLEEAVNQLQDFEEAGRTKASEIQKIDEELNTTTKELELASHELVDLQKTCKNSEVQFTEARQKAEEARSNLAASQNQGDVLLGLNRLHDSGRISGFHGRLGDLGKIDDKYDIAISTACPALNNIVVENVDVGQACIDHLRKNNLGRAMFILLDRLAKKDLAKIATPENAPRLFDLVQLKDDRFAQAFYSVLQNTLVAKDLTQANRIAYGKTRWRVVTLDGQLIDKSGTMSGGGNKVVKGGMSSRFASSETQSSVAKLEGVSQAKESDIQALRARIAALEIKIATLESSIPKLETQKSRLTLDLQAMAKQRSDLKRRAKVLQAALNSGLVENQRVSQVQASINDHEQAITQLLSETAGLEEDIRGLQEQILDVGGIKLRTQKSKVDGLADQIDALSQRCDTANLAKSRHSKDLTKHNTTMEAARQELEGIEADLKLVQSEIDSLGGGKVMSKEVDETQYALDESSTKLQALKTELDDQRANMNAAKAKELELRNKLDEHKKRFAEESKKLYHWQDKSSRLVLQELSEHFVEADASGPQEIPVLTEDELDDLDTEDLKQEISQLEELTQTTKVDIGVLDEYLRRCEDHAERAKALSEAVQERDLARGTAEDLRRRRLTEFMTGFNIISMRLKEMYQMITMGGNAELELVDSLDPFSEGILFSVMPPKKSWKNISNLSGGEKTLSSLALVFALHHYKPTPLYVMDEIDAALDFRNVSIVANYIKDRTKNAQFIVISLRNNMFELAARLVGIYKTNNSTKSIAIENREIPVVTQ